MTDAPAHRRLAELYRASMAQSPAADAEALRAALTGQADRGIREEILSLAAANPAQAALLKTLAALRDDADELQRGVRALRRPAARPQPVWAALAASLALAAVVAFGLRPGLAPQPAEEAFVQDSILDTDRISSVSFEADPDLDSDGTLFSGDFDS
jgi:hypothetical protein